MTRAGFATEFLLRELLAALGAAPREGVDARVPADSFSESLSEDSESQTAPTAAAGSQSRVMLVRRTTSSCLTVTLVDREFDVEAFVPSHVSAALLQERGFQTLSRLRGIVVRVTRYHFATMARCLAADAQSSRATSVSVPSINRVGARVYLWVDALVIVEENELAVNAQPEVYSHPAVAERLQALSDAELEKQLMINQGLPPIRMESDRFDDDRPLREEDCVIPEDQEQQLEEQDDWGLPPSADPQPTDSELIEENGHVPMSESQVGRAPASQGQVQSTQDSLASSGDLSVVLSGNSMASSVTLPGNPSVTLSGDVSVDSIVDSQKYPFQQEDIRETFVVGSDLESDTEDENDGVHEVNQVTPSTPGTQQGASSSTSVHSSPAPTTPKPSQSSCMIVDLTDDSPEKASPAASASAEESTQDVESKTEANDSQHTTSDAAADRASSHTPMKSHQTPEMQKRPTGWGTIFRKLASNLVGLGTPSAEDSHPEDAQPSDEQMDDFVENDQQAAQLPDRTKEENELTEHKHDEPEEFFSSQATVVLQYAVDNDEDANAFEYEGMVSDDMASPRSAASRHNDDTVTEAHNSTADASNSVDDDLTLTEDFANFTATPREDSPSKEEKLDLKTPSPSAQAVTPGAKKRAEIPASEAPSVSTHTPALHSNDSSPGNSDDRHPVSPPPNTKDPVLPTNVSAKLSPAKSPSKLVISVGPADNRSSQSRHSGLSTAKPQASKRSREQATAEGSSPAAIGVQQNTTSVSSLQPQSGDQQRAQVQKRRRREILSFYEGGSQSPQFEQPPTPFVSRRRPQSDRATIVADSYSLDSVCRSLGSHTRDQGNEDDQARSSRQPRRAWKRYENLFPPLNMTRLKQTMAEGKDKATTDIQRYLE
ncbi:hypothetical protein PF010_g11056 [Phytophthora fragariae]|uniref:Telomere replication protein EST3 n=1 Tax=Phytophthora fragariae TaxID=53985 RepID=A0A6G0L7I4_9STRA|nr:hypothetical protein PF010_g11056 [Phytophthora fragariae]